jgi:hypothetical protein
MNRAMRQHPSLLSPAVPLDPTLQLLLDAGFVERDGCLFLAAEARPVCMGELVDQTGREALVNHVHVESRVAPGASMDPVLQGLLYARALTERLHTEFPGTGFDVVFAASDSVTVRFCRRRANEPPWIAADVEGYEHEAVLVRSVE